MLLITITGSCLLGCNGEQQECIKYGSMEKSSMKQALDMVHYCKNDKSVKNHAVVAIIDTKYDLPEIENGDLWVNTKEIPNNGIDDDGLEIMPITVLGDDGEGTASSIIKAIQYAEINEADICNLSIATYEDNKELQKVIYQSDMLFIVAAGNMGEELEIVKIS